jgi:hypothetical protein
VARVSAPREGGPPAADRVPADQGVVDRAPVEQPYLALALLRGLRIASSTIVIVILLGLVLPHVVADLALYHPAWTGPAWFGALLAIAVADAVLVARRRSWGAARWPAAAVLAVSVWATALLPPAALVGPAHQTLGSVGWFGVLLFADRGVGGVLGFLAAHVVLTVAQLGLAGRLDAPTVVQLAVVVADTATAEAVARRLHLDREERYAGLRESVLPLLRGVGDGTLSPAAPAVQRRAAVEAARLRRLFAEEGDVSDPLATELGALVDLVERRGADVRFVVRGHRPVPPPPARRALLEAVGTVLLAVRRSARVTLSPAGDGVAVSVVADRLVARGVGADRVVTPGPEPPEGPTAGEITTVTVADEERTWVEARWTPSPS